MLWTVSVVVSGVLPRNDNGKEDSGDFWPALFHYLFIVRKFTDGNWTHVWIMWYDVLRKSVLKYTSANTHIHTRTPLSGTTRVSRYQKGKTNLDFTEAGDSEWQWHQLGHMQVCTWLQTDNHANTPPLSFLQAGCPSCRPTNSVKALTTTTV